MVKDGTTIVIGGLRKDEKTSTDDQIPYLGSIPVIGAFFKSATNRKERTELLILLTPHIITGATLTTGDERDIQYKPGKEYDKYDKFTQGSDFKPRDQGPGEIMKPYAEYSALHGKADGDHLHLKE